MKTMTSMLALCVLTIQGCATTPDTRQGHSPDTAMMKQESGESHRDKQSGSVHSRYRKTPNGYYITDLSRIPGQPETSLHCEKPLVMVDLSVARTKGKKTKTQRLPGECKDVR